jgi:GNAT superfamily N-acetyltransferase
MRPKIRSMTSQDRSAISKILCSIPEFKPSEVVVAEEVIDNYLSDPLLSGYSVLVAEIVSIVVGYICYGPTPLTEGTWDIYWMAVGPDQQGQGIGGALLTFAEEEIKRNGGRSTFIETSSKPAYERIRRFHSSQGYELLCSIADFYAIGDDKLIYQKRLG